MRQIVLDTETTGLEPSEGHRIIEIGCVELVNRRLTGNSYHQYVQPDPLRRPRREGHPRVLAGDGAGADGFGNFGRNQSSSSAGTRPG